MSSRQTARAGKAETRGAKRPQANNAKANTGYRFREKDPMIDRLIAGFSQSDLSYQGWAWRSGLSETTLRNWDAGKTMSPQYRSIVCAAYALNLEFGLYERGSVDKDHALPSTTYYEGNIKRWQREHKERQPKPDIKGGAKP